MNAFIHGVVVSSDDTPVSGAAVMIRSAPEPVPDIAIISDSEGHFMLENLPEGHYVLEVASKGDSGRVEIDLYNYSMTELTIQLEPRPETPSVKDIITPDIGVLMEPVTADPTLDPFVMPEFDPDEDIASPSKEQREKSSSKVPTKKRKPAAKRSTAKRKTTKPKQASTTRKRKPRSKPASEEE
ncbi:MAG: carboxypeptidase-like regulatory domain-containing protein [Pseudomonadota bacterium]